MRNSRKLLLLSAIVCFVCIGGYCLYKHLMKDYFATSHGRAVYEALTINWLEELALSIKYIVHYENEKLPKDMKSLSEYVRKHMEDLGRDEYFDPNDGVIIDMWGTPVTLVVTNDEYTFISSGYNRKYENGKGDDLAVTFDPFDLEKRSRTTIQDLK